MFKGTVLPSTLSEQTDVVELDLVFLHREQWKIGLARLIDLNIGYDVGPYCPVHRELCFR
jgi:hypothetical protein